MGNCKRKNERKEERVKRKKDYSSGVKRQKCNEVKNS